MYVTVCCCRMAMEYSSTCRARELQGVLDLFRSEAVAQNQEQLLEQALRSVLSWSLHNSSQSLSGVVASLNADLRGLSSRLDELPVSPTLTALRSCTTWTRCADPLALGELLKTVAARVSYGYRSPEAVRGRSVFEDSCPLALWRWEAFALPGEAEGEGGEDPLLRDCLKNVKLDMGRAGRAVKAVQKAIDELVKSARKPVAADAGVDTPACAEVGGTSGGGAVSSLSAEDEVKVAGLEDRVTKALLELHKSSERRQSLRKRLEEQARRRDEQRAREEQARLDKEAKLAAAAAAVSESGGGEGEEGRKKAGGGTKPLSDKQLKEQALKEKQQHLLMSFLGRGSATPCPSPARSCRLPPSVPEAPAPGQTSSGKQTSAPPPPSPDTKISSRPLALCEEEFLRHLLSDQAMTSISAAHRQRFAAKAGSNCRRRRTPWVSLTVTVCSDPPDSEWGGGGGGGYSEIKDVRVRRRRKLLCFAEDYRPPYW